MAIGLILSNLIEEKKIKKTELSNYLDIARNTLDDYLSERTYMTSDKIEKIAAFFGVTVSFLFGESNKSMEEQLKDCKKEIDRLNEIISIGKNESMFLAIPINTAKEFLDLREMKDKVIRVLSK